MTKTSAEPDSKLVTTIAQVRRSHRCDPDCVFSKTSGGPLGSTCPTFWGAVYEEFFKTPPIRTGRKPGWDDNPQWDLLLHTLGGLRANAMSDP